MSVYLSVASVCLSVRTQLAVSGIKVSFHRPFSLSRSRRSRPHVDPGVQTEHSSCADPGVQDTEDVCKCLTA